MKTTKKLAALFLSMVMALSLMAMTAAAYGETGHVHDEACCEEEISPRWAVRPCIDPNCDGGMELYRQQGVWVCQVCGKTMPA